MPQRVIIDTDPGIDDALALLLALVSRELKIVTVTTVSGNVPVDTATRNVFKIFSLFKGLKPPHVAMGSSKPLQKEPAYATCVHGDDGLGGLKPQDIPESNCVCPSQQEAISKRHAIDEILYQISVTEQPLTLIALGPLTNIASAIRKDRDTMLRVNRLVLMGGAAGAPGNITPTAEFNMYFDPHAAAVVFSSGLPITMVGLDVTREVTLTKDMIDEAISSRHPDLHRFLCQSTHRLMSLSLEREGVPGIHLHDPLTVGAVIDPSMVTTQPMHVEVETRGQFTEGMAVADRRPLRPEWKSPPNVEVALGVDSPRFLSFFLERLCQLSL